MQIMKPGFTKVVGVSQEDPNKEWSSSIPEFWENWGMKARVDESLNIAFIDGAAMEDVV